MNCDIKSDYEYLFSIIVAVYNSEVYLEETIGSIINQSLSFVHNVQLILVNDGSTDGSEDILLKYQQLYPDNILVFSQENQGQASARNLGLKYATGKYINFLDSDDYFSENTLNEVNNFFLENNEIKIAYIPKILFERMNCYDKRNYRGSSKIVNLSKNPNNPLLSVSSTFIDSSLLTNDLIFDNIPCSEDILFINRLLLSEPKYGVITDAKYYQRQRLTFNGIHDKMIFSDYFYTDYFEDFYSKLINLNINGIMPKFIQYTLLYDLKCFLIDSNLPYFLENSESNSVFENLHNILINVDDEHIVNNNFIDDSFKEFFLILKKENYISKLVYLKTCIQNFSKLELNHIIKVSVIIPVYNVERYLETCLLSVINQSLKEIEIICIDDGSSDNSLSILKDFMKRDDRIRVISKSNGGQAIARNIGINQAFGEYIGFVDSDDYIDKDMFKKLYENAICNDADVTMCNIKTFDETTEIVNENDWYYSLKCFNGFNKPVFNNMDTKEFTHEVSVTPVNKIYKRNYLLENELFFPSNLIFEDEVFFYDVYLNANRISYIDENLYTYRINRLGSTVTTNAENDYTDIVKVFQKVRNILKKVNLIDVYKNQVYNKFFHGCLARYSQTSEKYKPNFWKKMKEDFIRVIDFKEENLENSISIDDLELRIKSRVLKVCRSNSFDEFKLLDSQKIFSIIMAVYNTEDFLDESISSIIGQSLGFIHNVQLILVNDGSTDGSEDILLKYQQLYPDNILVFSQENQGQASARNLGLNYATGEYINFLDSDDYFSYNTLKEVYEFFIKFQDKTDVVGIPIIQFGRINEPHVLNNKFSKTRVIDLTTEPNNPQLSAASSFISSKAINNIRFPTNFVGSEDAHFINKILLSKKTLGSLTTSKYYYRRREDFSSTLDTMGVDVNHFNPRLKLHFFELINYSINKLGFVPKFIQYTLTYDLQWILSMNNNDIFTSKLNFEEFIFNLKNILQYIEDNVILYNNNIRNSDIKKHMYSLKYDKHDEIVGENVLLKTQELVLDNLKVHKIWLDIVEFRGNNLFISGLFNSRFNRDNISIIARKSNDGSVKSFYGKYIEYETRLDRIYLPDVWQYNSNFDILIPLMDNESSKINLFICYHKDGDTSNFSDENLLMFDLEIDFNKFCSLSSNINYIFNNKFIVVFDDNSFNISQYSFNKMRELEYSVLENIDGPKNGKFRDNFKLIQLFVYLYPLMNIFKRFRSIYLFMDRINLAQDNSEQLFRYSITQKDSILKFFIIDGNSDDYKRLRNGKHIVKFNSLKHRFLYLFADKVIVSHPDEEVHNPFFKQYDYYSNLISAKKYFIQHGVTQNNISKWLKKYDKNISLISTVSDFEKEAFIEQKNGYDDNIINTLGFPRFDKLNNTNLKKQILIMPTWLNLDLKEDQLKSTKFIIKLKELLHSDELFNLCEEYGYDIVFRPHPNLLNYLHLLDVPKHIRIDSNKLYSELFNESSLLITDYSSTTFDFAYLKKPIIYYQYYDFVNFDKDKAFFKYDSMGFGDVIKDSKQLFEKIEYYFNHDCKMEDKYVKRVDSFYKYVDTNNSKRVYDWIKKH